MSDVRETLAQLPPRLESAGTKLLNWIGHTGWEHGHHADEALLALAEEILRLRAHLGCREQYLLDESAIHPHLPARSGQQFGHAIHADTCSMCDDDAEAFKHLQESGDRSEAGRLVYVGGTYDIKEYLTRVTSRSKLGEEVPTTVELADKVLKALDRVGERARKVWSK
ncbi:hypothetical protein C5N14_13745 [Micromonospora sp. MW-13]|uniref:hypothetical protein n=1 Tax=Micromonospora sp. MW-13 TaxID=2094022 RepID=UPI000E450FA4|nr:hypothetical protein [Micromonospora sp. MW-13]RGC68445.1 hypothetical protein C5N14_13745 [Micromonospora sp. MW-13]